MHAIKPQEVGGPEVLVVEEMPTPTPGVAEALVRVEAIGVNFIDVYHRTGLYPLPRPLPIGLEGAGVVEKIGPDVHDVRVGDRVAWTAVAGSYASHVLAPVDKLVPVPDQVDLRTAAALLLQGITAHYLTQTTFPVRPGHTALVHAAAGGVGLLLVQMAKRAGAQVIATVSTEAKAALARGAGADHVILYTQSDFVTETKRITQGDGVQVVYDSVGKTTFDGSLEVLARRGFLVLYGQSSGPVPPFDPARLAKGSYFFTRPSFFHYTATRDDLMNRCRDLFDWVGAGKLAVRIGSAYPLAQAAQAHQALAGRQTTGKILLVP
jgi:NADPH2:quinone reductase